MTPRYGPLSLLLTALLPILGAPAIHSTRHGLACVAVLAFASLLVVRDWPATLKRLALVAIAAGSVTLSTWLYGGHDLDVSVGAGLRILYLVIPAAVLTPFIDPSRLGDHLAQRVRLPARPVVAGTAALQRLESMGRQWDQISRARRARGLGADGGLVSRVRGAAATSLTLMVSTMRMSASMALAMDARGFAAAQRRTFAEPAPWQWRDTAILGAGVLLATLPWVLLSPVGNLLLGVR
jgi:energy-coupling factor transporter transmembrane protein EcfT